MSLQPLIRRDDRCASIIPVPTQRRTILGSRQRFTPELTVRTVETTPNRFNVLDRLATLSKEAP